jgi:hypothetical protein
MISRLEIPGDKVYRSWIHVFLTRGLICLLLIMLMSCANTGPSTIARDRFDYVTAISESWKRQMLLNLVKVRYTDAPVFMDVASVINSYEVAGEVNFRGQVADKFNNALAGDQIISLGATGRYADRPTISYQPLSGDKFARSMMMPLPLSSVLFLIQSGYPADLVLRVCMNSINGLDNSYGGPGSPREGNPKFHELVTAIRESQTAGGMGMRMKATKDKQSVLMFLRSSKEEATLARNRKILELLSLKESAREFSVVYGDFPENDTEIAMLSRSILQILIDTASYIDVPEADLKEGSVYTLQRSAEQKRMFPQLIYIHCGPSAPGNAFVSVQYRGQWFWIEDRDIQSKAMLNFIMLMFSLTETGTAQAAPLVTVPAR